MENEIINVSDIDCTRFEPIDQSEIQQISIEFGSGITIKCSGKRDGNDLIIDPSIINKEDFRIALGAAALGADFTSLIN